MSYVLGFGGATVDLHIRCKSDVIFRDSNPSVMSSSPGGVMRNILDNASRLGAECYFLSVVGDDPNGRLLLDSCKTQGIDSSGVYISGDFPTACYMDLLGPDGDMAVAANDMAAFDNIPGEYLKAHEAEIRGAKVLAVDANPSEERLRQFCEIAASPIFADPVSVAKAGKFKGLLSRLYLIKPNLMELELLSGISCGSEEDIVRAASKLIDAGCYSVAVSLGKDGCYYADASGESFFEKLSPVENMVNATGAGDAFMAGLITAYADGLAPRDMILRALAAGRIAVCSKETINPEMSIESVEKELVYGY